MGRNCGGSYENLDRVKGHVNGMGLEGDPL